MVVPHHSRAGAVTAVGGTKIRYQKQDTIGVTVDNARDRAVAFFLQRVFPFTVARHTFINGWYHRTPQWLLSIIRIEQTGIIWRDSQRQRLSLLNGATFQPGKPDHLR